MLNKRFKLAKCKTSLKLATSRIKLMKNKKGIQMNQMKKELAQLLESGQDRTARIRVEHVIREEKMVAAYELVEIYCELIVARLPIIESQKTCPLDLKEAITSVIFAAPRCSDIPELSDVRKQFTAKYGKEFVSGAIELRPDCGVGRMLVEKLSAVAPDVQTKMKVLSAVAKEHNVNWDPTLFEEKESKPPDDLLNGPASFEKISTINVDPPKIQTSNTQNVHNHDKIPSVPFNFSEQNKRYTLDTQKSSDSTTHEDTRSSGTKSFNSNRNDSFPSWNMEFKDATSAAQVAAESAERASMAARAAAHLSSQGKIYSTESHDSDIPHNHSFNNRNPELQTQKTSLEATRRFSRPVVEGSSVNNFHQPDGLTSDQKKVGEKTVVDQVSESTKTTSYKDDDDDDDDDGPRFSSTSPLRNTIDSSKPVNFDLSDSEMATEFTFPHKQEIKKPPIELYDLIKTGSSVSTPEDPDHKNQHSSRISLKQESQSFLNRSKSDDSETGNELNFGNLKGGFRNKGEFKLPHYTKTDHTSLDSRKKPSVSISSSESDSDDFSDKFPFQSSKTRSQFAPPVAFFDDDSEPVSATRIHLGSGLSQRTKTLEFIYSKKDLDRKLKSSEKSGKESEPKMSEPTPDSRVESGFGNSVNVKKPSHVHPKLPEYDSLAARMRALRRNHQ